MKLLRITAIVAAFTIIASAGGLIDCRNYPDIYADSPITQTEQQIEYKLYDDHAEVISYSGSEDSIKIPSSYNGLPVTSIGRYAFRDNSNLTSVIVPESVSIISYGAFKTCSKLKEITILNPDCRMDDSTYFTSNVTVSNDLIISANKAGVQIDYNPLYNGDKDIDYIYNGKIYGYFGSTAQQYADKCGYVFIPVDQPDPKSVCASDDEITYKLFDDHAEVETCDTDKQIISVPDTYKGVPVTVICENAFDGCMNMRILRIGSNVSKIYHTGHSDSFTDIELSDNNQNFCVEDNVLYNKEKTQIILYPNAKYDYTVPETVTVIDSDTFYGSKLTDIKLHDSVTQINDYAFSYSSLNNIDLPDSVTSIGENAFCGCSKLRRVLIPDSVTHLGNSAFGNCKRLTYVSAGNGLDKIEDFAFSGCTDLTKIDLSESVESIGEYAFSDCQTIMSFTIPDSVNHIGDGAFDGCCSLQEIIFPSNNCIIGDSVFSGCFCLSILYADPANNYYSFKSNAIYNKDMTELIKCPTNISSFTIPDTVTRIADGAFEDSKIKSITVGAGVQEIGVKAFSSCNSLTDITILNPDCIIDTEGAHPKITINNINSCDCDMEFYGTVHCSRNSKAHRYAQICLYDFDLTDDENNTGAGYGDVNVDNNIDMTDMTELAQFCIGDISLDEKAESYADVTDDGCVDLADLATLKQFIMNEDVQLGPVK